MAPIIKITNITFAIPATASEIPPKPKIAATMAIIMSRPYVLQQIMMSCKKAGTVSIPGVYIGMLNEVPFGAAMNKALTFKMGQTHVQRYLKPLMEK